MKIALIAALAVGVSVPVYMSTAFAKELNNNEIISAVSGKTVRLATRWGSFPLYYNPNKQVTGDGEKLGLARFFAPRETGTWRVKRNQLCQTFPTWYRGRENCFTLVRVGPKNLKWIRQDGYSGTAIIGG